MVDAVSVVRGGFSAGSRVRIRVPPEPSIGIFDVMLSNSERLTDTDTTFPFTFAIGSGTTDDSYPGYFLIDTSQTLFSCIL